MHKLTEDISKSPLYSKDLAPCKPEQQTWTIWNMATIWIGMAVCIPTYLLASYMIKSGISWHISLIIIGLANIIITVPMVLNGHAGVKYGIPFPVLGRAPFGTKGVHVVSVIRAIVACGWFGVQTWIGGLAIYAIWHALTGNKPSPELDIGKFIGFGLFWLINIFFIWKGTESIRKLETMAAPILIIIGIVLIIWGTKEAGGFMPVLKKSEQLEKPTAVLKNNDGALNLVIFPVKDKKGIIKGTDYQVSISNNTSFKKSNWLSLTNYKGAVPLKSILENVNEKAIREKEERIQIQIRALTEEEYSYSSKVNVLFDNKKTRENKFWKYIVWLTIMVGFWATMSISIADITRYTSRQRNQIAGQFIGLPGSMLLYSFVGIFVTSAAVLNFKDILIAEDAPWDPVSLLARFENPVIVVFSQLLMLIATLSTNIAANVIAPANAFSNLSPQRISFKKGGMIAGIIGIIICPWWLLEEISDILIFISGLLGPILGIMLCDYFLIRKRTLVLTELYRTDGIYSYKKGWGNNLTAFKALILGIIVALAGYWAPALAFLHKLSWFTGFTVSFVTYFILMRYKRKQ